MTREQSAFSAMFLAVFLYSLFPLFNAFSVGQISPLLYILKANIIAVCIQFAIFLFSSGSREWRGLKNGLKKVRFRYLASAAFLANFAYLLLVYAFSIGSNSGITILYELWPLILFFLFPIVYSNKFTKLSLIEMLSALIAIIGLFLIIASSKTEDIGSSFREVWDGLGFGELLGLTAGILTAIATIIKSKSFMADGLGDLSVAEFALIDAINRGLGALYALLAIIIFDPSQLIGFFRFDSSFGFGVVEGLGGLLFWIAIVRSSRSSIQLLLHIAPVGSFLWLSFFGLAELTVYILFGAMLIFSANILAHFRGEQTIAFFMTVISSIVCGALTFFVTPSRDQSYTELLAITVTLFAILIGFLLARLADRNLSQRQECSRALMLLNERIPERLRKDVIFFLRDSFRKPSNRLLDDFTTMSKHSALGEPLRERLLAIVLLRVRTHSQ